MSIVRGKIFLKEYDFQEKSFKKSIFREIIEKIIKSYSKYEYEGKSYSKCEYDCICIHIHIHTCIRIHNHKVADMICIHNRIYE